MKISSGGKGKKRHQPPEPPVGTTPATAPAVAPAPAAAPGHAPDEERDLWWGAYSGWTMLPSFGLCLGLTALIVVGAWWLAPVHLVRRTIQLLVGAVWLIQLGRWSYRIFGYNYRLTTDRLYRALGFRLAQLTRIELTDVASVETEAGWPRRFGIGRIIIYFENNKQPPLLLEGVTDVQGVAKKLREAVREARERWHLAHAAPAEVSGK